MPVCFFQIAWALNKGIKPEYKQYWDVELGVTYIPWSKVKLEDLDSFCQGGMLDGETLCPGICSAGHPAPHCPLPLHPAQILGLLLNKSEKC